MRNELIQKYKSSVNHLDSKYLSEAIKAKNSAEVSSRLWELIVLGYLLKYPSISIDQHSEKGPDWSVRLNNKKHYYIEATLTRIPENKDNSEIYRVNSEINKSGTASCGNKMTDEVKSRISTRIDEKIKSHGPCMCGVDAGYILVLSYNGLSCELFNAIKTVYTFDNLRIEYLLQTSQGPKIIKQNLERKDTYPKPSNDSPISTNILGCNEYSWISAILFSGADAISLFNTSEKIPEVTWGKTKNDFVLCRNQAAKYPLPEDVDFFGSRTEIAMKNDTLVVSGKNIFPSFNQDGMDVLPAEAK